MGTKAKVLHRLAGILGSTQEKSVRSSWRPKSELIQSQCLTPSFLNPGSSSSGKAKRSHGHLGHRQKAVVIGNRSDNDHSLALVRLGNVRNDTRNGDGGAIDSRHKEPTQNDLVEVGIRAACGMSLISLLIMRRFEQADLKSRVNSYVRESDRVSRELASRRSHSLAPCDECCAHGDGPGRYL